MMRKWTLEKTIEVEFQTEAARFQFRIEAFRDEKTAGQYKIRLLEYDYFRLCPTFDRHPVGGADHYFASANSLVDGEEVVCESADKALQIALDRLSAQGFE